MRSTFVNRKAASAVLRLRTAGIDRELIGLCLVLLMVIVGHKQLVKYEKDAATAPLTSLTMMQS
jgi:hypothetical protein